MPDAVGIFADAEDYGRAVFCVGEGDGIVGVGGEPGVARVEASANSGVIVVQDEIFSIYSAGEFGEDDFHLRAFVSRDASVGDGDSPGRGGGEIRRLGRVDVSGFVADFIGDAGIGLGEGKDRNKDQQDLANLTHGPHRGTGKILTAEDTKETRRTQRKA